MRTRLVSLCFVLLAAMMAFSDTALATRPFAVAAPGTYSCKAATAANQVQPPPPLWELSGKPPTAQETAASEATKPLCPAGQVPSASEAVATAHEGVADIVEPGQASTVTGSVSPESNPYHGKGCKEGGCFWYAESEVQKKAIGMEYATSISEPHVSSFPESHSIDQLALGTGAGLNTYTVEAGWDVDPDKWTAKPGKPHFFVFINRDEYKGECETTGKCYDDEAYWTPLEKVKIAIGEALEPSPTKFVIGAENFEGNWWIWAGTEWIGYVSGSFWEGKFTKAESESNYGEVWDNEEGPTTEMGNGEFGANSGATVMTAPIVILNEKQEETESLKESVTNRSLYSIGDINGNKTSWHFGGPGLDPPPTRVVVGPSAVDEPSGSGRNAFYAGTSGKMADWWINGGLGWEDVELTGGSNKPVAVDTSPSAVYGPGSGRNIFYDGTTGTSNTIWQWYVSGGHWEDAELWSFNHSTNNEPVGAGTSPSAVYEPNGSGRNIFYIGANGTIWDWVGNSGHWENVELGTVNDGGTNEPALTDTSPTAVYESGSGRNIFYIGANGTIWDWLVNNDHWEDVELGSLNKSTSNEPAATSPSAVSEPAGSGRNAFYIGSNGRMWDWLVNAGHWENIELGTVNNNGVNEPGETTPSAMYDANGSGRNIFYEAANGTIWDWLVNNGHWEDIELGAINNGGANEPVSTETSPSAIYDTSSHRNAFYRGANGKIWDWWINGTHWEDVEL